MYLKMLNMMAPNAHTRNLPDEYQQVEYIEANGTQYIVPDIIAPTTPSLSIYIDYISYSTSDNIIIGSYPAAYIDFWGTKLYGNFFGTSYSVEAVLTLNVRNRFEMVSSVTGIDFYLNDNLIGSSYSAPTSLASDFTIFGANYRDRTTLYRLKIKTNNVNEYDFIPCYRKADYVAGLYEVNNGRFYTNDGTGIFFVGPDVN